MLVRTWTKIFFLNLEVPLLIALNRKVLNFKYYVITIATLAGHQIK